MGWTYAGLKRGMWEGISVAVGVVAADPSWVRLRLCMYVSVIPSLDGLKRRVCGL